MYGLLLCAMLTAQQQDQSNISSDRAMSLDGTWTVVSCEKNGQAMTDAKRMTCSIRNNTVTFATDKTGSNNSSNNSSGDMKTMKLEFGPQATIRVTELDARGSSDNKTKQGVCVVSKDFIAVTILDDMASGNRTSLKPNENFTDKPQTKSHFTVFLKRAD